MTSSLEFSLINHYGVSIMILCAFLLILFLYKLYFILSLHSKVPNIAIVWHYVHNITDAQNSWFILVNLWQDHHLLRIDNWQSLVSLHFHWKNKCKQLDIEKFNTKIVKLMNYTHIVPWPSYCFKLTRLSD